MLQRDALQGVCGQHGDLREREEREPAVVLAGFGAGRHPARVDRAFWEEEDGGCYGRGQCGGPHHGAVRVREDGQAISLREGEEGQVHLDGHLNVFYYGNFEDRLRIHSSGVCSLRIETERNLVKCEGTKRPAAEKKENFHTCQFVFEKCKRPNELVFRF